jgi:hypothetical protein
VQGRQPVIFETNSEEDLLRASRIANEFNLDAWYRGSGEEYRLIDVLAGRTEPMIIPLDFPDAPEVDDPEAALNASLAELRHWYLAPTNPAQLAEAGLNFAITSDGLASVNEFLTNIRTAVARGLSADDALAALTTTPADFLGIERTHGTLEEGKVANIVVSEGDLFTERGDDPRRLGRRDAVRDYPGSADRPAGHVADRLGGRVGLRGRARPRGHAQPPAWLDRAPGGWAAALRRPDDRPRSPPPSSPRPGAWRRASRERAGLPGLHPPVRGRRRRRLLRVDPAPNGADPQFTGSGPRRTRAGARRGRDERARRSTSPSSAR